MKLKLKRSIATVCWLAVLAAPGLAQANGISALHGVPNNGLSGSSVAPAAWANWVSSGSVIRSTRTGTSSRLWSVPVHWARSLASSGGGTITTSVMSGSGPTQVDVVLADANGAVVYGGPFTPAAPKTMTSTAISFPANAAAQSLTLRYLIGDGNGAAAGISGFPGSANSPNGASYNFQGNASPTQGLPFPLVNDPVNGMANWKYSDNLLSNTASVAQSWYVPLQWITPITSSTTITVTLMGAGTWAQANFCRADGSLIGTSSGFVFGGGTLTARQITIPSLPSDANVFIMYSVAPGGQIGGITGLPGAAEG